VPALIADAVATPGCHATAAN